MRDLATLTPEETHALLQRRPRADARAMRAQLVAQLGGEQRLLRLLRAVSFALDARRDFAYGQLLRALINGSSFRGMEQLLSVSRSTCYLRIQRLAALIPQYADAPCDTRSQPELAAHEVA